MSLLLKGLDLPEKGYKDIRIHASGSWTAYKETVPYNDIYGEAAQVPTPHGRLIDADAFLATIRPYLANDDYQACTFSTVKKLLIEHIAAAPTIIKAEEVKE